ncbi:MAG: pantoate--beta-alanine ligase [Magnetococcales bacterium]|nr:pantoate--beta-alanine ligase [Magnetococcales bacterium]
MAAVNILEDREALAQWVAENRRAGRSVGFVPTMGALHAGHVSLFQTARQECDRVIGSIFVNPTQFGPNEDFQRYPRTLEADRILLEGAGCDALFLPAVDLIYPPGHQTVVRVGAVAEGLCGACRPGHFQGVATVVAILFNRVAPQRAYFGLKDYQQFLVIRQMVRDLGLAVAVVGLPTVREADGLAMSSRNRYLTPADRHQSLALYRAMTAAQAVYADGQRDPTRLEETAREVLTGAGIDRIDYVAVRDRETLAPLTRIETDPVLLLAVHVGVARLIDNRILQSEL